MVGIDLSCHNVEELEYGEKASKLKQKLKKIKIGRRKINNHPSYINDPFCFIYSG